MVERRGDKGGRRDATLGRKGGGEETGREKGRGEKKERSVCEGRN